MEQEHALVVDPYIIVIGVDQGNHDLCSVMTSIRLGDGTMMVLDEMQFERACMASTQQVFDEICNHPWPLPYQKAQPKELPYYCRFNKKKWR